MQASRLIANLAVGAALVGASLAAAAQPQFSIADIGKTPSNNLSHATGISSSGDYVVGRGLLGPAPSTNKAYVWSDAGLTTLPAATGANNWAFAVNDSSVVVGQTGAASGTATDNAGNVYYSSGTPVMWKNGVATSLATSGRVFGINNAGLAVGSVGTVGAANQFAATYDTNNPGTASFIFTTTSDGVRMNTATAINNAGLIIGVGTAALETGGYMSSSMVYDPAAGTMTRIASGVMNSLATVSTITASDINNLGAVVGTIGAPGSASTPYLWTAAGGLQNVPLPAGMTGGVATGINDQGWIVGYARDGVSSLNQPFISIAGSSYLLSGITTGIEGWTINSTTTIVGIGNDGTIAGYATNKGDNFVHAFAISVSAVPEPSSYALLLAGLAAVGGIARRRRADR